MPTIVVGGRTVSNGPRFTRMLVERPPSPCTKIALRPSVMVPVTVPYIAAPGGIAGFEDFFLGTCTLRRHKVRLTMEGNQPLHRIAPASRRAFRFDRPFYLLGQTFGLHYLSTMRQTRHDDSYQNVDMKLDDSPRIVSAERMNDGLLIEFDDGVCGIYSATLLREILPQAIPVEAPEDDD